LVPKSVTLNDPMVTELLVKTTFFIWSGMDAQRVQTQNASDGCNITT